MTSSSRAEVVGGITTVAGAVMLLQPALISRRTDGPEAPVPARIIRVLGSRYICQGLAELRRPTPLVLHAAAAVDLLHAATMVAAARAIPAHRRAAVASAVTATALALAAVTSVRVRLP